MVQGALWPPPADPKVAVVDISYLRPDFAMHAGRPTVVTPRDKLLALVDALAKLGPHAIAIDADFSPYQNDAAPADALPWSYASPRDPWFFGQLEKLPVPVYLGAFRAVTSGMPHDLWLGDPAYEKLAAAIALPADYLTAIPYSVGVDRGAQPPDAGTDPADLTLSAVLDAAAQSSGDDEGVRTWPPWFATAQDAWHAGGFSGTEFVVNYSALDKLIEETFVARASLDSRTRVRAGPAHLARARPESS